LAYLLVLLIPNTYTILFWEFYFLPSLDTFITTVKKKVH
jgi:hypothetical protein